MSLELGIFTSKHDAICKVKFRVSFLGPGQKTITWNSEFSRPSMIPRVIKNSELSFLCMGPKTITQNSSENEFRNFRVFQEFEVITVGPNVSQTRKHFCKH